MPNNIVSSSKFHHNFTSSSSFYTGRSQIWKRRSSHVCLFVLLGLMCVKAAHKMLMKLTLGVNFNNILCTARRSQKRKKILTTWLNSYTFGTNVLKADEIYTRFLKVFPLNWNNICVGLFSNVPCHLTCPPKRVE